MNKNKIIFIRHGESLANIENRFSGWLNVDITKNGYKEAYKTGLKLKKFNYKFDLCYTSFLKRAIKTSWGILDGLDLNHIPIIKSIYLNERHYGDLSGLNKNEGIKKFGKKNIESWLNEYENKPPLIKDINKKFFYKNYSNFKKILPLTESLNDVLNRVKKFWKKFIKKNFKKNILIVSHSNSLKVLMKYIDKNKKKNIELIPNTTPIVYEFDNNFRKLNKYLI